MLAGRYTTTELTGWIWSLLRPESTAAFSNLWGDKCLDYVDVGMPANYGESRACHHSTLLDEDAREGLLASPQYCHAAGQHCRSDWLGRVIHPLVIDVHAALVD